MRLFKRQKEELELIEVEEIHELIDKLESACERAEGAYVKLSSVKKELDKSIAKAVMAGRNIQPRGNR